MTTKTDNKDKCNLSIVCYYLMDLEDSNVLCDWHEGLHLIIEKNGVEIKLEGEEILKLAKNLPLRSS